MVDWDWGVRIAGFGHSRFDAILSRYLAPECYEAEFLPASDVFAFGLILFEIVSGGPGFPESMHIYQIAFQVAVAGRRPEIPDSVLPDVRAVIEDCWEDDPEDRPSFASIVDRLAEMQFKVTEGVNSAKIARFVNSIEDWEYCRDEEC
jgi:hypothetical protein